MRVLWRPTVACRPIAALLVGMALLFPAAGAFGQSSLGPQITNATGQSQADAVRQNEKALLDEVLGAPPPGGNTTGGAGGSAGGGGGAGGGAAAAAMGSYPSGRLRTLDHDGLRPLFGDHYSYSTKESSEFGNTVITVPGTVLGGTVKLSGFVGHSGVSLDLKSNAVAVLRTEPIGQRCGRLRHRRRNSALGAKKARMHSRPLSARRTKRR